MKTVPGKIVAEKINSRYHKFKTIIRMCLGLSKENEKELVLHLVLIQ